MAEMKSDQEHSEVSEKRRERSDAGLLKRITTKDLKTGLEVEFHVLLDVLYIHVGRRLVARVRLTEPISNNLSLAMEGGIQDAIDDKKR
jgi:hypothetical protein